jgi:hypothetical protein
MFNNVMMSFLTSYSILIILDSILTRQFHCLFYYTSKFLALLNMLGIEFSLHCLLFCTSLALGSPNITLGIEFSFHCLAYCTCLGESPNITLGIEVSFLREFFTFIRGDACT